MVPLGSCIDRSNCICHFGRWKFSCYHWTLDCTCRLDILLCGKVVISFQILWSCNAYYAWLICFTCSTQSHSSILAFGNRTKRFGLVFKVVMLISFVTLANSWCCWKPFRWNWIWVLCSSSCNFWGCGRECYKQILPLLHCKWEFLLMYLSMYWNISWVMN